MPKFSQPVLNELSSITSPAFPRKNELFRDCRAFPWVSIDNDDSLDLDQLTFAQDNKIYVAISDVDEIVKVGSYIDKQANHNTTSIYTPGRVFPMLPVELSNNLTSLNENTDRCAIIIETEVKGTGQFLLSNIYPGYVHNHAKLTYNSVADFLEKNILSPKLANFAHQLTLQDRLARNIQSFRNQKGTLEFADLELESIMENEMAVNLKERKSNRAQKLIENFMIASNVSVTHFLNSRNKPTLRRIVRTPKRWDRIVELAREFGEKLPAEPNAKALRAFLLHQQEKSPDTFPDLSLAIIKLIGKGEYVLGLPGQEHLEHFDLAEAEYAHSTAPNRRYPDLVMQRLLKHCFYKDEPTYTHEQLQAIAIHCSNKEVDAAKVERKMMKCAAAMVMQKDIGRIFEAMITGASEKGTWARLTALPVEGKVVRGFEGLDVGDYIKVKLVHVDIPNGFIDFHRTN